MADGITLVTTNCLAGCPIFEHVNGNSGEEIYVPD
uniref:Uncharacterized protein n=1 Tax=Anguilla anguilla TaxID=7936 RepID=A0A0E9PY41_ANGAN